MRPAPVRSYRCRSTLTGLVTTSGSGSKSVSILGCKNGREYLKETFVNNIVALPFLIVIKVRKNWRWLGSGDKLEIR